MKLLALLKSLTLFIRIDYIKQLLYSFGTPYKTFGILKLHNFFNISKNSFKHEESNKILIRFAQSML